MPVHTSRLENRVEMLEVYKKLTEVLNDRDRQLAFYVLLLTLVVAIVEVMGVASIMPFMAVLTNPGVIHTNPLLSFLYENLLFETSESFLFFLGVGVFIFLVGSSFLKALVVWAHIYFANTRNYYISSRVVTAYLKQPYSWFVQRNSSSLAASVLEEVSRVVNGCLYPLMRLISNAIVAILILALLTYADPTLAFSAMILLSMCYGIIIKFAGKRLKRRGQELSQAQNDRLRAVTEAFGGIKDVKIGGYEAFFLNRYRVPAKQHAMAGVSAKLWAEVPSFAMQALIFGSMMLTILYLMQTRDDFNSAVPVLALYALGAYKLMPALQEIYKQFVDLKYHSSALDKIHRDIARMDASNTEFPNIKTIQPMGMHQDILLKDVRFSYNTDEKIALAIDELKINSKETVGFVGGSGAGKTTTADILLGLLFPQQGGVYVDDERITKENLIKWQRSVGYVPQQIYLSDASVAENIAFGVHKSEMDIQAVERAARTAHIHDFIVSELEEGYQTAVGERGVRLSGGQRQRLGIARALYHDPDVLILDEATSALDNVTEKVIMKAVEELGHKKTIIIIAHRLSTIQHSDNIIVFDSGHMVASGTYSELRKSSEHFKKLVDAQHQNE